MTIKNTLKTSVAAAALFAAAAPVHAGTVSNGNDTASVTLSGHFNKLVVFHDSGSGSVWGTADHGGEPSRARIAASAKLNEAVTISMMNEWGMTSSDEPGLTVADTNSTLTASNDTDGGDSWFSQRHAYLAFEHATMGTLTIGHTSEATDGIVEFGGVGDLQFGTGPIFANGVHVQTSNAADNVFTTLTTSSFFHSANGGRTDVLRYDTPSFGGVSGSVSYANNGTVSVAGFFGGKFGGFEVNAGVGYMNVAANSGNDSNLGGGITVGHESGISVDFNAGTSSGGGGGLDGQSWAVGANYAASLTALGTTTFRIAYMKSEDATVKDDEGKAYLIGVEQETGAGASFYLAYQLIEVDRAATNYEDVSSIVAGTKVLF